MCVSLEKNSWIITSKPEFDFTLKTSTCPPLEAGSVAVKIAYSSLNYKDALAFKPKTGVLKKTSLTPGIDLSGTVVASRDPRFAVGQAVLATGYDLGVAHDGGFSTYQQLPGDWLVPLPKSLDLKSSMLLGTSGVTAALCVMALEEAGLTPDSRVLVTGATGGVAATAIAILQLMGCKNVTALTRKTDQAWLKELGAAVITSPAELLPEPPALLGKQRFDFVIDTVGGQQLGQLLPLISYNGLVATCGNAGGIFFETSVLPFILRGITLKGIDSVAISMEKRREIWSRFANAWPVASALPYQEISLPEIPLAAKQLTDGLHRGKTIVKIGGAL